ncbi:MAG: polysaccharide deacetylase family protein [Candidatus Omnitrophota bacterium]
MKILGLPLRSGRVFQAMCKDSIFIFNYHEVNANPSLFTRKYRLNVPPELFSQQLKWIKQYFNVISPVQLIENKFDLPAALITFDDGFASTFEIAAPILRSNNIPAVVFMNMAPVEGKIFWPGLTTYLCYYDKAFPEYMLKRHNKSGHTLFLYCRQEEVDEYVSRNNARKIYDDARAYYGTFANLNHLRASSDYGLFLGNHLYNHYNAAILTPEDLKDSYITNENKLRKYSNNINCFSYPFGQPQTCYNAQTDRVIFSMGAKRVFTAYASQNRDPHSKRLHRLSMHDNLKDEQSFKNHVVMPSLLHKFFRKKYTYI